MTQWLDTYSQSGLTNLVGMGLAVILVVGTFILAALGHPVDEGVLCVLCGFVTALVTRSAFDYRKRVDSRTAVAVAQQAANVPNATGNVQVTQEAP